VLIAVVTKSDRPTPPANSAQPRISVFQTTVIGFAPGFRQGRVVGHYGRVGPAELRPLIGRPPFANRYSSDRDPAPSYSFRIALATLPCSPPDSAKLTPVIADRAEPMVKGRGVPSAILEKPVTRGVYGAGNDGAAGRNRGHFGCA